MFDADRAVTMSQTGFYEPPGDDGRRAVTFPVLPPLRLLYGRTKIVAARGGLVMGLFSKPAGGHVYTSEWRMRWQIRAMARRGYAVKSATVARRGGLLGRFGGKSRCSVIYEADSGPFAAPGTGRRSARLIAPPWRSTPPPTSTPYVIRLPAEDKRHLENEHRRINQVAHTQKECPGVSCSRASRISARKASPSIPLNAPAPASIAASTFAGS